MPEVNIKHTRSSGVELLRILAMLAIIMHHYVVHSGIENLYDYTNVTAFMLTYQILGMLGKTMVNVFPLITGYYMCTKSLTLSRYLKMYLEVKFYRILIYLLLAVAGLETLSGGRLFGTLFSVLQNAGNEFASSFLVFYLLIPFYNRLIGAMSRAEHRLLVGVLLLFYTMGATFFFNYAIFSEIPWYIVLYLTAAYIRLYPAGWERNIRLTGSLTTALLVLDALSIYLIDSRIADHQMIFPYYMVYNANKLLAFLLAFFLVLFFLYVEIPYKPWINRLAKTSFGVYLIHDDSAGMRQFLWTDLFHVTTWYGRSIPVQIVTVCITAVAVYLVCSLIDCVRIYTLEKPFFRWFAEREEALTKYLKKLLHLEDDK